MKIFFVVLWLYADGTVDTDYRQYQTIESCKLAVKAEDMRFLEDGKAKLVKSKCAKVTIDWREP